MWKDSATISSISFNNTFIQVYITSPLYICIYIRRMSSEYLRALQTSWRGWAVSTAVHSMECRKGRARSTGGLSLSRGCCLWCTALPALEGVLPQARTNSQRTKQQTHSLTDLGGIYSWWHSASPTNGSGSHGCAPVSWAYHILCPAMVSPNANWNTKEDEL